MGEFLATKHSGQLGISVWSNRSYYQTVHHAEMDETLPVADSQGASRTMKPLVTNMKQQQVPGLAKKGTGEDEDGIPKPKDEGLVTMSGLSPAHWKSISSWS